MIFLAILLTGQAAAATPAPPQRISILAKNCPAPTGDEITVCAPATEPRLPLPEERGPPDYPVAGNLNINGMGALAMAATPCATVQGGCPAGVDVFGGGTAAVRLIGKLIAPDSCCERPGESTDPGMLLGDMVGGLKRAFGRKPDKSNRVAIALDAPPPTTAGRLLP